MTEAEAEEIVRRDIARSLAISGRIAEAERRAQERLRRRSTSAKNLRSLLEAFQTPGLRSARDFNRSAAFKTAPRPKAPDTGGVTFHFSVSSVSKTNHTVAAYAGRVPSGTAAQHESYIERDGAAETFIDPESVKFAIRQRELGADEAQLYIERDTASEKHGAEEAMVVSSFGNIGTTKEDRFDFWQRLERAERSPRDHMFTINPFRGAAFWEAVERHRVSGNPLPPALEKALDTSKSDVSPFQTRLNDVDAIALLKFAHSMGDFQSDGAIKVSLGRGGRVQTRIIAELPHEITAAQRLDLAKAYCSEFDRQGLPYWAVIHAPDKHNDRRNFHIHIALSERPAKQMVDPWTGKVVWDFEIVEEFRSNSRNLRTRRPFMQERIREMSSLAWIGIERRRFCNVLNSVLERSGSSKRYDHRSYKAMGLTQKAKKRIDPKLYAKERKGQVTEQGIEAAHQQWSAAVDDLHQQCKVAARTVIHTSYKHRLFFTTLHSADHPDAPRFLKLIRKATDLHSHVLSAVVAKRAVEFVADKMVSRARLKTPVQRTKVDRVLIEVAAELRATEGKQFKGVADRLGAEYRQLAYEIGVIRSEYVRTFQKRLFGEMVDLLSPVNQSGAPEPPVMTLEEIIAMTEKWFPKHTSLSAPAAKPAPQKPKESAVDRLLGKNFFNPKNAGRLPERPSKAAPQVEAQHPRGAETTPLAHPAAPQKHPQGGISPLQPKPERDHAAKDALRKASSPPPRAKTEDGHERELPTAAKSVQPAAPSKPEEERSTPTAPNVPQSGPPTEVQPLKKRKARKAGGKTQPAELEPANEAEARRRAILAHRRKRSRGR